MGHIYTNTTPMKSHLPTCYADVCRCSPDDSYRTRYFTDYANCWQWDGYEMFIFMDGELRESSEFFSPSELLECPGVFETDADGNRLEESEPMTAEDIAAEKGDRERKLRQEAES